MVGGGGEGGSAPGSAPVKFWVKVQFWGLLWEASDKFVFYRNYLFKSAIVFSKLMIKENVPFLSPFQILANHRNETLAWKWIYVLNMLKFRIENRTTSVNVSDLVIFNFEFVQLFSVLSLLFTLNMYLFAENISDR